VQEFYFTRFLICSEIPLAEAKMNDFLSKTIGTGVFLLALNWYLDRRETIATLVCNRPNRIPGKQN
jgi:hypothetical protein